MKTALRVVLRTTCEFFPWVAGFVAIYYTFYWWGLGSGFSAFLFMMGTHALIRFIRARSSSECLSKCSRRDVADAPNVSLYIDWCLSFWQIYCMFLYKYALFLCGSTVYFLF